MTLLMMLFVILLSMLMIPFYSKCDQASDLWEELELVSELGSDPWDTIDCNKKWVVDTNAGKTLLGSFGQSNKTGAIDAFYLYWLGGNLKLNMGIGNISKKVGSLTINWEGGCDPQRIYVVPLAAIQVDFCNNKYAQLMVLHLFPFLKPWLVVKM